MSDSNTHDVTRDLSGQPVPDDGAAPAKQLDRIGRYRIERVLGQGGFGLVYLAHDEQLDRRVAIKVPHVGLVSQPEDSQAYLAEARTVANLDHPGIVPVHDVGSTEDCPCYVVSKYVEGTDLSKQLKERRPDYREAAELVATVAAALHYAHKRGLVHRDVKPGNILIGKDGKPYVVDFGLALREENIGQGPKYAGTPAYMSPEQARGEGHRVDGRSDIFSLGVVFYELLAGRRPFRGETRAELFEQVTSYEAKPLRQYDEKLPKELERICHKAMAKRASERYSSAHDMAEDLRLFLHEQTVVQRGTSPGGLAPVASSTPTSTSASASAGSSAAPSASLNLGASDNQPIKIVPKGLRSFDAHDADFFLELLPGPRDRDGLPDSLRFWKVRIEETDPDNTFSVGLIYGPSGCGKSSLVKAGLLPRLTEDVISVYIEATPKETETLLLHGLRKRCPALEDNLSLKDTLAALRRGQGISTGKKVLIVLDQFEQWLHAKKEEENTELVQSLRQCDGGRVQCIAMVRDDFWMAATRFMRELEVRLLEGRNSAAVDLFPIRHAAKVLSAFGRAFGALPEGPRDVSRDQKEFLKQAVAGLSQDGKVICVRLALFAEMMKGKPWTPATLRKVGGTEGVGVTFLEETFSAATAPPEHRYHQKAARGVLKSLLPESGIDIKGHMRSQQELLEASGYASRPRDFDDLLRILDSEIRLITPTDPEGKTEVEGQPGGVSPRVSDARYYQLTHDYLVHSLRDWLTRKQKETRRGRAELRLAERAALWQAKPENRHLPAWWEYVMAVCLVPQKNRTALQQKMLRQARRVHAIRWGAGLAILLVIGLGIWNVVENERQRSREKQQASLRQQVTTAIDAVQNNRGLAVPFTVRDLQKLPREMVVTELNRRYANAEPQHKFGLAYARAAYDDVDIDYLCSQIARAAADEVDNLVAALERAREVSMQAIERRAKQAESEQNWRLKTRLAIVALHLEDERIAADMCRIDERPDPIQRTIFIDEFSIWHGNVAPLAASCRALADAALRSGVCLALGSIPSDRSSEAEQAAWKPLLTEWFQTAPDKGTHSAAGWTLRSWGMTLPKLSVGEHALTHEQKARRAQLTADVEILRQRIAAYYQELPARQAAWERQLREQPAALPASLSEGLVAHYRLDETEGKEIANAVNGQPGGVYEGPDQPEWVPGVIGRAVRLTSKGGHFTCGEGVSLERTESFSYGCWFLSEYDQQVAALLAKMDDENQKTYRGFDLWLEKGRLGAHLIHEFPANALKVLSVDPVPVGRWQHVMITYDGSSTATGMTLYVGGRIVGKRVEARKLSETIQNNVSLHLGRRDKSGAFQGAMDDVRIYDRRLSDKEVHELYASGVQALASVPSESRTPEQQASLTAMYRRGDEPLLPLQTQLAAAEAAWNRQCFEGVDHWFVNSLGMTLLAVEPGVLVRVEPQQQSVKLARAFYLCDREISVGQFQHFISDANYPNEEKPTQWESAWISVSPTPDHPVQNVSWHDAVLFCNWLSRREGRTVCYERIKMKVKGRNPLQPGVEEEVDDWQLLPHGTGYRLPTEAEWEYACRAGTTTDFASGSDEEMLRKYACFQSKLAVPGGSQLPNGWGLFDMHGNVFEWCQDWMGPYGDPAASDPVGASKDPARARRGGSWNGVVARCRSAFRNGIDPTLRSFDGGFRLALSPPGILPETGTGAKQVGGGTEVRSGAATTLP